MAVATKESREERWMKKMAREILEGRRSDDIERIAQAICGKCMYGECWSCKLEIIKTKVYEFLLTKTNDR